MARPTDHVADDFGALTSADFDYSNPEASGWEKLQLLSDEVRDADEPATLAPAMFSVMERLHEVDLGSPGPLVHALESLPGVYEPLLAESVRRKPSPLSVWMVNRILNREPEDRQFWLALLQSVAQHPGASDSTKADANGFLEYQGRRRN